MTEKTQIKQNETDGKACTPNQIAKELNKEKAALEKFSDTSNQNAYYICKDILSKAFLNDELTNACGDSFWNDIIDKIFEFGEKIGLNEESVEKDICDYATDVFMNLENWEAAYYYLCCMARYSSCINIDNLEKIVKKSGHWITLQKALEYRLKQPLAQDVRGEIKFALDKLNEQIQ